MKKFTEDDFEVDVFHEGVLCSATPKEIAEQANKKLASWEPGAEMKHPILDWIKAEHAKVADGCKGSCLIRELAYVVSDYYEGEYWVCRFGGYCFGNLPRHV